MLSLARVYAGVQSAAGSSGPNPGHTHSGWPNDALQTPQPLAMTVSHAVPQVPLFMHVNACTAGILQQERDSRPSPCTLC